MEPARLASPSASYQAVWGGQIEAISRLLLGYDPQLTPILQAQNLNANQRRQIEMELLKLQTPLAHPSMPVQDVIDLAGFPVDLTRRYVAFMPQADTVGGDADNLVCVTVRASKEIPLCRRQGWQIGSGVIEGACKQVVCMRMKKLGSRWSERGANLQMAIRRCVLNNGMDDYLDWQAERAIAAWQIF